MENTKHTPGPWKTTDNRTTEQISVHTGNEFSPIAFLNYQAERGKNNSPEQHANAKLIAAAPDLLYQAEQLIEYLGDEWATDEFVMRLQTAIKSATE